MKASDILMWNRDIFLGNGYLYNGWAARDVNMLPSDWSLPTDSQFDTLLSYLNDQFSEAIYLKQVGTDNWLTDNGNTNSTGFTALGSGIRDNTGFFDWFKQWFRAWGTASDLFKLYYSDNTAERTTKATDQTGLSIRPIYIGTGSPTTVTDYDGNVYDVVQIGTQYWTVQNWKCTHYNDGGLIPNITDNTEWASGEGNETPDFGYLYNFYAANDVNFGITDWSIPSEAEYITFYNYLNANWGSNYGGAAKSTSSDHWDSPNTGATNQSGFTSIGGGERTSTGFRYRKQQSNFWLSDQKIIGFDYNSGTNFVPVSSDAENGYSIRLLYKGTGTPAATVTDIDGNVYDVVQIGTQYWLSQDFRCTKLMNGEDIPNIRPQAQWDGMTTKAYCIYDNQTKGSLCAYNNDESNV